MSLLGCIVAFSSQGKDGCLSGRGLSSTSTWSPIQVLTGLNVAEQVIEGTQALQYSQTDQTLVSYTKAQPSQSIVDLFLSFLNQPDS